MKVTDKSTEANFGSLVHLLTKEAFYCIAQVRHTRMHIHIPTQIHTHAQTTPTAPERTSSAALCLGLSALSLQGIRADHDSLYTGLIVCKATTIINTPLCPQQQSLHLYSIVSMATTSISMTALQTKCVHSNHPYTPPYS